jgi:nitrous oxidase accessory protein
MNHFKPIQLHLFGGLILLLLAWASVGEARPSDADFVVSPDGPVTSIQEAVNMASPGDHIRVQAGVYVESNIMIDKQVTLEGIGFPEIDGNREGHILIIAADSVTVRGLFLKNSGRSQRRRAERDQ